MGWVGPAWPRVGLGDALNNRDKSGKWDETHLADNLQRAPELRAIRPRPRHVLVSVRPTHHRRRDAGEFAGSRQQRLLLHVSGAQVSHQPGQGASAHIV